MKYIQLLNELTRTDLPLAGGKGANLGALIQAGLPVPPGFCVTTPAYNCFISANQLGAAIQAQVAQIQPDDPVQLDAASLAIRQLFEQGKMPEDMAAEIRSAYRALSAEPTPVAVRSSATAEDLPDLSFAGQQDTYLNITGEEAVLRAVMRCWASLWTARAIGYRARNQIDQAEVALAVVIQCMVPSEAAGVLFTANPLTGKRCEVVIDATLGLGEALVSGMVEPDHYVVDTSGAGPCILKKTLGRKARSVRSLPGGGTQVVDEAVTRGNGSSAAESTEKQPASADLQALPDAQIIELAHLGRQAEQLFGAPQDMEWGWAGDQLYVLQSRAITSLYPLPEHPPAALPADPLEVFFSFAYWQGMLQPITPLGQDSFTGLVAGMGRVFGSQATILDQDVLLPAGERLYVNITGLVRSPSGRGIARIFIDAIDPVSLGILDELLKDPRLALDTRKMSLSARLRLMRPLAPLLAGILYNLAWPARGRARLQEKIDRQVARAAADTRAARNISELVSAIQAIPESSPVYLLTFLLPGIMSGMGPLQILIRLAKDVENGPDLAMELTRGLPHNVTTEMDLKLWAVSRAIHADPPSDRHFQEASAAELSAEYLAGRLPSVAQLAVDGFLKDYGFRAVAEIDVYRPRWKEEPQHIFQVLKSYLEMDGAAASPETIFNNGGEKARLAGEALIAGLRRTRFGAVKARLARFLIRRVRELAGLRETPKFTIVRMLGVIREALLSAGQRLAAQGLLAQPDDIFFLHSWEIKDLAEGRLEGAGAASRAIQPLDTAGAASRAIQPLDTAGAASRALQTLDATGAASRAQRLVEQRRQSYQREMSRRRVPRILLGDGTTFYEGASSSLETGENVLSGTPVSAGTVEGTVRVVLDPHGSRLLPGEILVCPATDPAWTPLFLAAAGLVMEVGGMMTHGSVVAREYGIPAVVGVNQATTRLKTGQRVRVDGSLGQVLLLEDSPAA